MPSTVLRLGWLITIALGAVACGPARPPLAHTQPSADALASAVLGALEQRDEATLRALAVDEPEFREHVWPELPAAKPERNLPFGYVWRDLSQKSDVGLARTLSEHGGQQYQLKQVSFRGGTTRYRTFAVHRDSVATVIDRQGVQHEVQLFGSALELDGRLKVFSYVVD